MVLSEISNSHSQEHFRVLQGEHRDVYWFSLLLQFLPIDANISSNRQNMYNLLKDSRGL